MSTRYVWEKYTVKQVSQGVGSVEDEKSTKIWLRANDLSSEIPYTDTNSRTYNYILYEFEPVLSQDGTYVYSGQGLYKQGEMKPYSSSSAAYGNSFIETYDSENRVYYQYIVFPDNPTYYFKRYVPTYGKDSMAWRLNFYDVTSVNFRCFFEAYWYFASQTHTEIFYCYRAKELFAPQKDVLQGYVSSSSSSAYPQDGVKGDYWYVYKGSDSIDATEITYSTTQPRGGEDVTVALTPAAFTYGGTIKYQWWYSFSQSGSSWTKLGDPTTDTSKVISIPRGTQYLRVRVQASDDIGFTSSSYTTGATLNVINIRAYIGIDGKARKIKKIYIGVNGKAREVKGGYVGVDGKARRWF